MNIKGEIYELVEVSNSGSTGEVVFLIEGGSINEVTKERVLLREWWTVKNIQDAINDLKQFLTIKNKKYEYTVKPLEVGDCLYGIDESIEHVGHDYVVVRCKDINATYTLTHEEALDARDDLDSP